MSERLAKRIKLPTQITRLSDNRITVKAAMYQAEGTSTGYAVVLIPGWSMEGTSRGLRKMAHSFSQETGRTTITISSDFKHPTPQTTSEQVAAIDQYLTNMHVQNVLLVGHSEGTTNALALAKHFEQKRERGETAPNVSGVVLMTPIGLTPHTPAQITQELGKAAFYHIPKETVREIKTMRRGVNKFFDAGIIGLTMAKNIAKDILRRGPKQYARHVRRELANMTVRLENHLHAPLILVLGEKDNVVPFDNAIQQVSHLFPDAHIVSFSQFGHHGMPYQQHQAIAQESAKLIQQAKPRRL